MKVLFLASSAIGHMDFGGLGFIRMDERFRARGHETRWLTFGDQASRLQAHGCAAETLPELAGLCLRPVGTLQDMDAQPKSHIRRVEQMRAIMNRIGQIKPDLLVVDRLFSGAGLIASRLDLPFIAIGTPGGYWRFFEDQELGSITVRPMPGAIDSYAAYGEVLQQALGAPDAEFNSAWLNSPYLNAHFLGRTFYSDISSPRSVSVYHHSSRHQNSPDGPIGISLGNQGQTHRIEHVLGLLAQSGAVERTLTVFAGKRELQEGLLGNWIDQMRIQVRPWVDFSHALNGLSQLVFLGGIGTIWHCVDQAIPMVIVPGLIGDQQDNAHRVEAVRLGAHVLDHYGDEEIVDLVRRNALEKTRVEAIEDFRARSNYDVGLDELVDRAIAL